MTSRSALMHMLCKVRSENGYGFLRPGLKMGVENGIFWSEIGSGFGDAGGTPPPKISRSTPPPPPPRVATPTELKAESEENGINLILPDSDYDTNFLFSLGRKRSYESVETSQWPINYTSCCGQSDLLFFYPPFPYTPPLPCHIPGSYDRREILAGVTILHSVDVVRQ